jgi:hypothetical protein
MQNMKTVLLIMALGIAPAFAEMVKCPSCEAERAQMGNTSWHFLSQTYGGTFSLIKNLTKKECDFIYNRAKHLPATPDEIEAAQRAAVLAKASRERADQEIKLKYPECFKDNGSRDLTNYKCFGGTLQVDTSGYTITSDDIKTAECFQ